MEPTCYCPERSSAAETSIFHLSAWHSTAWRTTISVQSNAKNCAKVTCSDGSGRARSLVDERRTLMSIPVSAQPIISPCPNNPCLKATRCLPEILCHHEVKFVLCHRAGITFSSMDGNKKNSTRQLRWIRVKVEVATCVMYFAHLLNTWYRGFSSTTCTTACLAMK